MPDSPNPGPTDQVMVLLPRNVADSLLNGMALDTGYHHAKVTMRRQLRSALSQEAEERREFQGERRDGLVSAGPPFVDLRQARRTFAELEDQTPDLPWRLQSRSTYTYKDSSKFITAWSDLEEGE